MSNGVRTTTSEYPEDSAIVGMLSKLLAEITDLTVLESAFPLSAEVTREKARCEAEAEKLEAGPGPVVP